jgi:hypothetical protein
VKRVSVRAETAWMLAAAGTVLVALLGLLATNHHYFWYGDTAAAYYGWWYHLGDLVRHGQWAPLDPHAWRAGNFAAEGQWGLWSPLSIAIGLLATVWGNVLAVTAVVKLGLAVTAALGIFRLVRSYDAPPAAAYVAAVLVPMGGMTQYLDLPSWAAGQTIWALFPWVWWGLRRTMLRGTNPLPLLVLGYLLVSVGYVYGTIMLVIVIVACLVDCAVTRDRAAFLRTLGAGVLLGLVAVTVYLPGVLTAGVTDRTTTFSPQFTGKFTTDPLTLLASVLPTNALSTGTNSVLPYTYVAWLLPALLWIDVRRAREGWRPLAGLLLFTVLAIATVLGPGQFGPLRWPLRLQPFLVQALVVTLVVLWSRFGVARPSVTRLALSLGWVGLSVLLALRHSASKWPAHLTAALLAGAAITLLWWLVRRDRRALLAPVVGVVTLAVLGVMHGFFPDLPSPQRHAPTELATYQDLYPGATGDLLQVGASDLLVRNHPAAARVLPIGSAWYLTGIDSQSTYTTISHAGYKARYCIFYQGSSCPTLLDQLFRTEPTTGERRVDLLGVSSLLLIRGHFLRADLEQPPPGWQVAGRTRYSVLWTRKVPVPGAGSVAWTSPGTSVSAVSAGATGTSFRVDSVPADGGTVVLRLIDWPGYSTSAGSITHPVDGYLLTVHLPSSAAGSTVDVDFHSPGWTAEIGAWVLALLGGAVWSAWSAVVRIRRSRRAR